MKKISFTILYNLLAILIIFSLCEIFTRFFFPQIKPQGTDKSLIVDNMYENSHGLKPQSSGYTNGALVKINPYGFREFHTKMDTSKNSWLLLGDSVTMGIGVEADSTFAGRLQSRMDSVNIANPSVVGYAIDDYKNLSQYFIIEQKNNFHISRVIMFWCLNDIYLDVPDFETPGGSLRYVLGDLIKHIRTRSRFYMLLKTLLFDRPKTYYQFDEKFYSPERAEFKNAINTITEIKKICHNHNVRFDIVLLPYEYQLRHPKHLIKKPQQLMAQELEKRGIHPFEPIHYLTESGHNSKEIFLFGDGIHLSELGHRLIAEYLLSRL